ncbi:MAG: hypothetical protein SOW25_07035 [Helicobacter sp.]|nr:hypothetical protein [Helicobacter sp.]
MFFTQTILSAKEEGFSLKDALLKQLQSGLYANFANLCADKDGIYFTLPNQKSIKVLLYQAKVQEAKFRVSGDPQVHLCGCSECLKALNSADFLAIRTYNLLFSVGIYSNKVQTKIFHQKPLEICPECARLTSFSGNLQTFLES